MSIQKFPSLSDQTLYETGYEHFLQANFPDCINAWSALTNRRPRKRKLKEQLNIVRLKFVGELLKQGQYNLANNVLDECSQNGLKKPSLEAICSEYYFRLATSYAEKTPRELSRALQCLEKGAAHVKTDGRFNHFQQRLSKLAVSEKKLQLTPDSLAECILNGLKTTPYISRLSHINAVYAYKTLLESSQGNRTIMVSLLNQIIAFFGNVLNDETYWDHWKTDRAKIYQTEISQKDSAEAFKAIETHLISVVNTFARESIDSEDLTNPLRFPETAWELESTAQTALRQLGGIITEKGPAETQIFGGPFFIAECHLTALLQETLQATANRAGRNRRLFSPFGICEIFLKHEQPEKVLTFLQAWEKAHSGEAISDYREIIQSLSVKSTFMVFEKALRQKPLQIDKIFQSIRNILQLAQHQREETVFRKQIVEKVLGRADALKQNYPRSAISILESARLLLEDSHIVGVLSALLREYSVEAANRIMDSRDTNALEKYAADLRYALTLSPHIKQTRLDYCTITRRCALWRFHSGEQQRPLRLIQESIRAATEGLALHKNDPELQRFLKKARQSHLVIDNTVQSQDKGPSKQLAAIQTQIKANNDPEVQMALEEAGKAVNLFHRQELEIAFKKLQGAYQLAPDSMLVRDSLHNLMVFHKEQLLQQNRLGEALQLQQQIFQLFPGSHL